MKAPTNRTRRPSTHDWLTNAIANLMEDLEAAQTLLDGGHQGVAQMEADTAQKRFLEKVADNKGKAKACHVTVNVGRIGVDLDVSDRLGEITISLTARRLRPDG